MARYAMFAGRFVSGVCFAVTLLASFTAGAEEPKMPKDQHDLSGVWMNDNTLAENLRREGLKRLDPNAPEPAPREDKDILTAKYKKIYEQRQAAQAKLEVGAESCDWPGMPVILTYPYPLEILHTPGRITFIYEAESQVRRIFLNRDKHLPFDELDPSYNGDSVGHWEGNTLVIDTIGFNDHTLVWGDLPHSEKMHIVERIHYVDADTIHDEVTITDPLAFTEPIKRTIVYSKRPTWRIREYNCMENNRDAPDANGNRTSGVIR